MSLDYQDLSWDSKGRTQGAFSVLSFALRFAKWKICKKERSGKAELRTRNPRISRRKEEGTEEGGGRREHALTQLGFAFLQYLFFKIFFFGAEHFFSLC